MKKRKILWVSVLVLALAITGAAGFYFLSGGAAAGNAGKDSEKDVTVVSQKTGYPASEKDARVYAVAEKYLAAQAGNDRAAVKLFLSEEHKLEWTDDSYLMTESAFDIFDEVKLADVRMGVIDFNRLEGKEVGTVLLNYSVQMLKDGKVEAEVELVEELGLANYQEMWLIERSLRRILMPQ
jgi:hypothetical protein